METKKDIRKRIRLSREAMDAEIWTQKTEKIVRTIVQMDLFRKADDLYCYVTLGNEVGTDQLIEEAWRQEKHVWVPRVDGDTMEFYEITSWNQVSPGTFGVMEPEEGIPASAKEGLMIVPGVAFDRSRNRVGYGKGYYDKYISAHSGLVTVAVAFDLQLVTEVPADQFDIRPMKLVTETAVYEG